MPATPSRAAFVQSEFRRASATTATPKTRYGDLARESDDPVETFFDSVSDAQTIANARITLLSAERRRFRAACRDLSEVIGISYSGAIPVATYVDADRDANRSMLVSEITFDLAREQAIFTLWG